MRRLSIITAAMCCAPWACSDDLGTGSFGQRVKADPIPKPISGGTMALDEARGLVAVADSDRDVVHIVSLGETRPPRTIALTQGDDPGRALFLPDGSLFVVLRSAGAVAAIDPIEERLVERLDVCPAPRGIAFDPDRELVLVVCVGGEMFRIDPRGERPTTSVYVADDLRDIVVEGGRTWVSTFRRAELLRLESDAPVGRVRPVRTLFHRDFEASTAWRMRAAPEGGVLVLHQMATTAVVETAPAPGPQRGSPYGGGGFAPLLTTNITQFAPDLTYVTSGSTDGLAVDFVLRPQEGWAFLAAPGAHRSTSTLIEFEFARGSVLQRPFMIDPETGREGGQAVAVEMGKTGKLIAFSREPPQLSIGDRHVDLAGANVRDTGHDMFHRAQSGGVACAHCHPEGRDDGHTWNFADIGLRRTQTVRGLAGTEPFHWDGDMEDLGHIMSVVMVGRMGSGPVEGIDTELLERWLETLAPLETRRPTDHAAIDRGRAVFQQARCGDCHSGDALTNNETVHVGTGAAFQVPSLRGVRSRAPYMHDGCAATLHQRFDWTCGGREHGDVEGLDAAQRDDLVTFLETL